MKDTLEAVIFDMDGTLFDTERLFIRYWSEAAAELGLQDAEEALYRCLGANWEQVRRVFVDKYGPQVPIETLKKTAYGRYLRLRAPLKDGALEFLTWLRRRGIPAAVASGSDEATIRWRLEDAGIAGCFSVVVDGRAAPRCKPAPDLFLAAAERLGVAPEGCWVIEDSFNGVRAAGAAGMHCIMVPDLVPPDGEIRSRATAVLPSLRQAAAYLERRYGAEQTGKTGRNGSDTGGASWQPFEK